MPWSSLVSVASVVLPADSTRTSCTSTAANPNAGAISSVGGRGRHVDRRAQRREIGGVVHLGELSGDLRFDHLAGGVEIADRRALQLQHDTEGHRDRIEIGMRHDGSTTTATADLEQPLRFEHPQRLPQRRAGDAELHGEVVLGR